MQRAVNRDAGTYYGRSRSGSGSFGVGSWREMVRAYVESVEKARSFERGVRRDGTTAGAVIKGGAS